MMALRAAVLAAAFSATSAPVGDETHVEDTVVTTPSTMKFVIWASMAHFFSAMVCWKASRAASMRRCRLAREVEKPAADGWARELHPNGCTDSDARLLNLLIDMDCPLRRPVKGVGRAVTTGVSVCCRAAAMALLRCGGVTSMRRKRARVMIDSSLSCCKASRSTNALRFMTSIAVLRASLRWVYSCDSGAVGGGWRMCHAKAQQHHRMTFSSFDPKVILLRAYRSAQNPDRRVSLASAIPQRMLRSPASSGERSELELAATLRGIPSVDADGDSAEPVEVNPAADKPPRRKD
eukprot:gene6295-biopygen3993